MNFDIDKTPPSADSIASEHVVLEEELKLIKRRDTIMSFILILIVSVILSVIVYLYTENTRYALITATVIPLLGSIMTLTGLVSNAGFRSAAHRIITINHKLFALETVSEDNSSDVEKLAKKYVQVQEYIDSVRALDRGLVNGELAMFWEWDASTMAKTARGREYIEKAKNTVEVDEELDEPQFDI